MNEEPRADVPVAETVGPEAAGGQHSEPGSGDDAGRETGFADQEELPLGSGERAPRDRAIAVKEYYSISEVCDLVDLRPHVLRYWETQFAVLNPSKNRSGNRVYQRKEIRLILLVKHLLYEEKYTVEGAKQKLEQLRKGGELLKATKGALDKQMVALLRAEMSTLTELLTPPKQSA